MSKEKFHIDDNFIPDGLEFREEYMHAALNAYKRSKRIIALKRTSFVLAILLLVSGISVYYLTNTAKKEASSTVSTSNESTTFSPAITSGDSLHISNEKTSSANDLKDDELGLYKNGQSPAVESSEPTQDLSTKAVDMGGSMSSGVELPGQLSTTKVKKKPSAQEDVSSVNTPMVVATSNEKQNSNNNQVASGDMVIAPMAASEVPTSHAGITISPMPYRPIQLFSIVHELAPIKPMQEIPYSRWSMHAMVGVRAWSDFAFNRSPMKIDGVAAVGIGYELNKQLSAEMNAHFYTVSGNASPYVSIQRQYAEGFNETTNRYYTHRFYNTGLSAIIKYNYFPRHTIGTGWSTDYLLTADNRIETGVASSYESPTANSKSGKGYVQGYNTIQHALLLNYEYALGRNKSVGAQYQLGLTDVTKNEFFGNKRDKNSMLSLYFRIKLNP